MNLQLGRAPQLVSFLFKTSCSGCKAGRLESSEISFTYLTSTRWLSPVTLAELSSGTPTHDLAMCAGLENNDMGFKGEKSPKTESQVDSHTAFKSHPTSL